MVCDSPEIRLAAVDCCVKMLTPFVKVYEYAENPQKSEVYSLIKKVLECLIKTSVVDQDVEVRLTVLRCFCQMDRNFLMHLAQKEMLDTLFMTLYDENFKMQESSVGLLAQLADLNPAFVFPKLRKILMETISKLVNSQDARLEEHSAKIISCLSAQVGF